MPKGHRNQMKSSQWPKVGPFEQNNNNKMVLDYNPKNKIIIHKFMLM